MKKPSAQKGSEGLTEEAKEYLNKYQNDPTTRSINIHHINGLGEVEKAEIQGTRRPDSSRPSTANSVLSRLLRDNSDVDDSVHKVYSSQTFSERSVENRQKPTNPLRPKHVTMPGLKGIKAGRNTGKNNPGNRKVKRSETSSNRTQIRAAGEKIVGDSTGERPNIIWRPPIKVYVAKDLKKETEKKLLENASIERPGSNGAELWGNPEQLKHPEKEKEKNSSPSDRGSQLHKTPLVGSTFVTSAKAKPKPKPRVGAWYLDVKYWGKKDEMDKKFGEEGHPNGSKTKQSQGNAAKSAKQEELAKQIPDLFISKAYKAYLKQSMRKQRNSGQLRIPEFLADVDDSEIDHQ